MVALFQAQGSPVAAFQSSFHRRGGELKQTRKVDIANFVSCTFSIVT